MGDDVKIYSFYLQNISLSFWFSFSVWNLNIFRYNYEGKYLDAQELKDFLEKEQMVGIRILEVVSFLF